MAKVKKLYWLGKGLVKIDGKLYGKDSEHGRAFPTAKVGSERLAQWVKDGRASSNPFDDDAVDILYAGILPHRPDDVPAFTLV